MENTIQLEEKNIVKFGVKKADGTETGLVIKIDLQDIELPLRISKMQEIHKKNVSILKQKARVIEKQDDKKGNKLLSWKQEEKIKLVKEFYDNEMIALDMFIGQGMTKKILKAIDRFPYYDMFDNIIGAFDPVFNKIEEEANNMLNNIKEKYGDVNDGSII